MDFELSYLDRRMLQENVKILITARVAGNLTIWIQPWDKIPVQVHKPDINVLENLTINPKLLIPCDLPWKLVEDTGTHEILEDMCSFYLCIVADGLDLVNPLRTRKKKRTKIDMVD